MEKKTRMTWKLEDAKYTTRQDFLGSGGKLLRVMIDAPTSAIHVMEVHDGFMAAIDTQTCADVKACKKEAKKLLQKHGVNFYEEVRKKKEAGNDEGKPKEESPVGVCKL
jgi:hypothetical protein